eukprot:11570521-Ditylum_brightwellii.AAC.1
MLRLCLGIFVINKYWRVAWKTMHWKKGVMEKEGQLHYADTSKEDMSQVQDNTCCTMEDALREGNIR